MLSWKTIPTYLGHGVNLQELASSLLGSTAHNVELQKSRGEEPREVTVSLKCVSVTVLLL